jgi:hypothetical protein
VTCIIVERSAAAVCEGQRFPIMRIAEPGYDDIILAVSDNQRGRAVKDELILLHRMNAILQFRSASLHESRRAFGLRIGERDLFGVTLDRMPLDSPFRHFA